MKKIFFILCVLVYSFHDVKAIEDDERKSTVPEWQLGGIFHKGKILNHSSLITPIIDQPAVGGAIFLSKQTYGANRWNAFFNYPEYGFCYTFLDLGNPNYVGAAQCLFPYLNFHLFNNMSRMNLNLRIGAGFAFVEKIYHAETNPLNYAFGTHLNVVLDAQLQGRCKISHNWSFIAGAGITHISNGAYKMPNLGMNIISYSTGISHSFGKENRFVTSKSRINEKNKNWDCSVYLLGGIKEINPIGGHKYFAGDFNVEVTKKHLQYTRFGLSMDVTYDASEYDCIIFQSLPTVDKLNTTRVGISGGYVWLFGDLSLDLYFGTYLHEENTLYGRVYQRTSLRYPLSDRIKMLISLRNHKGKADYIGFGFGFRLTK
jgi:hypothetical protein